jgi:hypothetical protein
VPTPPVPFGRWKPVSLPAVGALLAPARFPWWLSGGYALELFAGRQMRPHGDIDVSIFRRDAPMLRLLLEGWDLQVAHEGVLAPWITATLEHPAASVWCRAIPTGPWLLQVMFDEGNPSEWVCHRHPDIRLPLDRATSRSPDGVAYLRPELQLLLKAKDSRPKDDADFATVFPLLMPDRAAWLLGAIGRWYPRHRWLTNPPAPQRRIPDDQPSTIEFQEMQ